MPVGKRPGRRERVLWWCLGALTLQVRCQYFNSTAAYRPVPESCERFMSPVVESITRQNCGISVILLANKRPLLPLLRGA